MNKQFRQGDVFIELIEDDINITSDNHESIPKDNGRTILAYGEATGHAHAINGDDVHLYKKKSSQKIYLVVDNSKKIQHEEHREIPLAPGKYEVVRQREYTPEEIRYVLD